MHAQTFAPFRWGEGRGEGGSEKPEGPHPNPLPEDWERESGCRRIANGHLADAQHDLSDRLPLGKDVEGVGKAIERKGLRDQGFDLPLSEEVK